MHQPGVVHGRQAREELSRQPQRPLAAEGSLGVHDLLQVGADQELHREEETSVWRHVGLVDAHDVLVIDAPDALDLVHEESPFVGAGIDLAVDDLDRHVAVDAELSCPVHRSEAAAGHLPIDAEAPGENHADESLRGGLRPRQGQVGGSRQPRL